MEHCLTTGPLITPSQYHSVICCCSKTLHPSQQYRTTGWGTGGITSVTKFTRATDHSPVVWETHLWIWLGHVSLLHTAFWEKAGSGLSDWPGIFPPNTFISMLPRHCRLPNSTLWSLSFGLMKTVPHTPPTPVPLQNRLALGSSPIYLKLTINIGPFVLWLGCRRQRPGLNHLVGAGSPSILTKFSPVPYAPYQIWDIVWKISILTHLSTSKS